jgi:hypothetical protein
MKLMMMMKQIIVLFDAADNNEFKRIISIVIVYVFVWI